MVPGAKDRAALDGSSFEFGAARVAIVEAAKKGAVFLDIHDATRSVLLELPPTPALDDVTSVVVVRIDSAARYGTTKLTDAAALEGAARHDGGTGTVALLRVADDITLDQLMTATEALKRAGMAHVVLGLVPANVVPPGDGWQSCPFPAAADADAVDSGVVTLSIDWDDQGRPGAVHVLESPGHGFGGAAALCALWQRSTSTSRCSGSLPCSQKLRVAFKRDAP